MQKFFSWLAANIVKVILIIVAVTVIIVFGSIIGKMLLNSDAPRQEINRVIDSFE